MLTRSLKITVTGNLTLCALLALLRPWLLGMLTDDTAILAAVHPVFWIAPPVKAERAANIVAGGALLSCGDARFTAVRGSRSMWLVGAHCLLPEHLPGPGCPASGARWAWMRASAAS